MSLSSKSPFNSKIIHSKINQNKSKPPNRPINVKMCQIPNNIEFNKKIKTNIISSSYFNLKNNKSNLILKEKKKNKYRNKLSNDIKTNNYSLIMPNNKKLNNNTTNTSNNISKNYSKLSINSLLITNSINKSKKSINNRKKNLLNEQYKEINKENNYSFKIKVNRKKEQLILLNSRNNSLTKNYNSKNNNNFNDYNKQKTIKNSEYINQSYVKTKSRNKSNGNKMILGKRDRIYKNCSVKSFFKKIELNNKNINYYKNNNNIFK